MKYFFVSTPIYYVNARPHLGHAYSTIVADSVARFHKLAGDTVFFLTGTDEHGDKIVQAAQKAGVDVQHYVDEVSQSFQNLWPHLEIENDAFIRTTMEHHKACVQYFLQKVYESGDIYFAEYEGLYCYGCERFYTEKELVDGKCPDHNEKPVLLKEKNYFFRMTKYLDALRRHIEEHPEFIQPERYRNEVLAMLREDLGDLCISRPKSRLTWGIELPFDRDFVTYVWFDALINYISALGYPEDERFRKFWTGAHHIVAKDILKPHAIFWPTMLLAAGLPLYKGLRVHGYWTVGETKMSKSLGNVVDPLAVAQRFGVGAFRYFLLAEMSFGQDASFTEEALVQRFNADLANDLGNLFSRTLAMTHKYCGGQVPECGELDEFDREVLHVGHTALANFQTQFQHFHFSRALASLWELVRHLNKYIDKSAPWALFKAGETNRLSTVLYVALEGMRKIALHLWPIMPSLAEAMLAQLGWKWNLAAVDLEGETSSWFGLQPGSAVASSSNLFPRQDVRREGPPSVPGGEQEKALVDIEDFARLELRVGTVVEARPHPQADRLLLVRIDDGGAVPRQVVAGIADSWQPSDLVGRQVAFVANLKPRKLRGQISQGMILAVKSASGLALLSPTHPVPPGSVVS